MNFIITRTQTNKRHSDIIMQQILYAGSIPHFNTPLCSGRSRLRYEHVNMLLDTFDVMPYVLYSTFSRRIYGTLSSHVSVVSYLFPRTRSSTWRSPRPSAVILFWCTRVSACIIINKKIEKFDVRGVTVGKHVQYHHGMTWQLMEWILINSVVGEENLNWNK